MKRRKIISLCLAAILIVFGINSIWNGNLPGKKTKSCRLCSGMVPSGLYLLGVNTGMLYSLEPEKEGFVDIQESGISLSFGYDEKSKTNVKITKIPQQKQTTVEIIPGEESIHFEETEEMFCETCAGQIQEVVQKQTEKSFVIFDAGNGYFYPITEGTIQIEDSKLEIEYIQSSYVIHVTSIKE